VCTLKFKTEEQAQSFVGTLLSYDVFQGKYDVTLDFGAIAQIMSIYNKATMIIMTDKGNKIMEKSVHIRRYDLSGPTGVVTLEESTYRGVEVNHG